MKRIRMRQGLACALAVLVALPVAASARDALAENEADAARTEALVAPIVAEAMKAQQIPGVSIAVLRGERVLLNRGYGLANFDGELPATGQTVYPIGSISKQFTAAAILVLADRGVLKPDDLASRHLPVARRHAERIRIDELARHTSGLREFITFRPFEALNNDPATEIETLHRLLDAEPLGFAPGTRWSYSNFGYQWLARIVEHGSGRSYEQFLAETFFKPLGLASMRECRTVESAPTVARSYVRRRGQLGLAPGENMSLARGDGNLCATALDLAKWARALPRGAISAPAYARLTRTTALPDGSHVPYGMGLGLSALDGAIGRVVHTGSIAGYETSLAFYPDHDLAIAVMTNRAGAFPDAIEAAIARALLGRPAPDFAVRPVPQALATTVVGEWEIGIAEFPVRIEPRDGQLWVVMPPPGVTSPLIHVGENRFVAASAPDSVSLSLRTDARDRIALTMGVLQWDMRRQVSAERDLTGARPATPVRP